MPYPKGKIHANHGRSIKCPNMYEGCMRTHHNKAKCARVTNRCWKSPKCKCR